MDEDFAIISQVKELYARLVYTHKTYEKCYEILNTRYNLIKILQIALSAITAVGIITSVIANYTHFQIISAIIACIQLFLNIYLKENNMAEKADKYSSIANKLIPIRERYLSLLVDAKDQKYSTEKIAEVRDAILLDQNKILIDAIKTFNAGYKKARNTLKLQEEFSFKPNEIDIFLPEKLR